ncbi:MAG: recombination mediator RecR [Candidatus Izemoplasmatales bacterium]
MRFPQSLETLIGEFMKYPGVGRKTAERFALHTIHRMDGESAQAFASAIQNAKASIRPCPICGHLTDGERCEVCADPLRDGTRILVVETSKDVFSIEKAGGYRGLYHVLNGALSPINGVGPEELNLKAFWPRVQDERVKEIILATGATQEGEATAMYIRRILKDTDLLVTRIAYGVPVGANLEFADDATLSRAIQNRRSF